MERGEKGGMVLDTGGADEMPKGGEGDDVALAPIEEANEFVAEQGRETNINRGAKDSEVGGDDQGEEGEVLENGEESGKVNDPKLEMKAIVEQALKEAQEKQNANKPPEPVKELTDEQWAKLEEQHGIPRSAIKMVTEQNVKVVNKIMDYIDSKFSKLEAGSALDNFAKEPGFGDATRYRKEVNEFLQDYDSKHWSNPVLLKKAVYYARGINADKNLQSVRNDTERNRKIAGPARPSSPGGSSKKTSLPPLTQAQREAAALMEGGESEYNKFRSRGRVTIE